MFLTKFLITRVSLRVGRYLNYIPLPEKGFLKSEFKASNRNSALLKKRRRLLFARDSTTVSVHAIFPGRRWPQLRLKLLGDIRWRRG